MPASRSAPLFVGALLVLGALAPAASAKPQVAVLEAPDVVVANAPENMTRENFDPDHVFSVKIRINNDDHQRRVNTEAIIYTDPSVDGCPKDKRAFPVSFVFKNRKLSPGETVVIGGSARPSQGDAQAYWPMAVSRTYRDARTNETVKISSGEHTFCANLRVSGDDPACDKPANRTCVIASAPWRSYVRRTNAPPKITTFSVSDETPGPGQQVLFEADATDASTQPRPDTLRYTWKLSGETKTGKVVRHAFTVTGPHRVTLEVTDGFDTVTRSVNVTVQATSDGAGGTNGSPGPAVPAVVGVVSLAALALRRRRP